MLFCYTVGLLVSVAVVRMNGQAAPDPPYAEVAGSPPPTGTYKCTVNLSLTNSVTNPIICSRDAMTFLADDKEFKANFIFFFCNAVP